MVVISALPSEFYAIASCEHSDGAFQTANNNR